MKIQIDTEEKNITLMETAPLGEVIDFLKTIFPKDWKTYNICGESITYTYAPHYPFNLGTDISCGGTITTNTDE